MPLLAASTEQARGAKPAHFSRHGACHSKGMRVRILSQKNIKKHGKLHDRTKKGLKALSRPECGKLLLHCCRPITARRTA